jgi:hypothetical protein
MDDRDAAGGTRLRTTAQSPAEAKYVTDVIIIASVIVAGDPSACCG